MGAWSDWINSEGLRKCRGLRQELGDAYENPMWGMPVAKIIFKDFSEGFVLER